MSVKRLEIQGVSFLYNEANTCEEMGTPVRAALKMSLWPLERAKKRDFCAVERELIKIPCKRADNSLKYQYILRKWRHNMKNDNRDKKSIKSAVVVRALILRLAFLTALGFAAFGTLLILAIALFK